MILTLFLAIQGKLLEILVFNGFATMLLRHPSNPTNLSIEYQLLDPKICLHNGHLQRNCQYRYTIITFILIYFTKQERKT